MKLLKVLLSVTVLILAFSMSGCQGNNSDATKNNITNPADINNTLPPIDVNSSKDPASLQFVFKNDINVSSSGQEVAVYIRAFDTTGTLNTEGSITVQYPQKSDAGQFSPNTATIVDGIAQFTYTAPIDLQGRVDAGDTFSDYKFFSTTNGAVTATLHVDYTPSSSISVGEQVLQTLALSESNITITQSEETKKITLFAYTDQSTTDIDLDVGIKYGNTGVDVGFFSPASPSIVNGRVALTYNGPLNLLKTASSLSSTMFTLYDKVNPGITAPFTVNFAPSVPVIRAESPTVSLTQDGENKTITILAFDSVTNKAFESGTILVEYPTAITNGSVSGGTFTQNEASIVNGKATFNFTGPNPLASIANQTFTFKYKENQTVSTALTMQYTPGVKTIKIVPDGNITITQNGEIATISLSVYTIDGKDANGSSVTYTPYEGGNIKIKYPDSVLTGKDIGSFNASSVAVANGKAEFTYTAPNPLDGNDSNIFTFYHDSQPTLSNKDLNISITPAPNQVVLTNYALGADYNSSIALDTTAGMSFYVEDESGVKIEDSNVTSMKVTVLNPTLGSLEDTAGNTGSNLTVSGKNNVQMNIKSNTLSGLIPIEVYTEFKDANNNDKNLTKVLNVVVHSGPPTAMSLSYAGTLQDAEHAKFIENWVLTVTDKYNNLVNTTPTVSMGGIIGYANSSASTTNIANYLYYDSSTNDGNLTDANPDTFRSSRNAFDNVDLVNDTLVLFGGSGYTFNTNGKWDINNHVSNELELKDDYNGSNVSGLTYAVGHNFRNEVCDGSSTVANVYAKDGNATLGTTGSMIIQVEYDYYLVGKSVVLWTNLVGENNNTSVKIGLGKKVTLRGTGLTGESYKYAKGYQGVTRLNVKISDTVEYYKNANFTYAVEVSGDDTNWSVSGTSMSDGNITDCSLNSGIGYVDVNITSPALNAGEIKIINILPSNEF